MIRLRAILASAVCVSALSASALAAPPASVTGNPNAWPELAKPAANAPSVLLILTDDVGYGASSTFGGPVDTPTFDAVAKEGLRYSTFTTTGICSPTRAALLTGRNHHAVNMANVTDAATGFDGYTSVIPKSAATGARLLADAGYSTGMFGKAHITPLWELGPGGPFDRWPTGLGFQHFYGFMQGDTNQWAPALYENTSPVEPPVGDPNYIFDRDMADKAIEWIRTQRGATPDKPFFVYYAPGTAHAPHHAPADWIARYKGRFDAGWDVIRERTLGRQKAMGIAPKDAQLAARPDAIPAWNTLSAEQKRVYARGMEVYAAALSFADHEIGRVIEQARKEANGNLMVVYIQGDNGGSAEGGINGTLNESPTIYGLPEDFQTIAANMDKMGGPDAMNHYSIGWAFAMNTPFPWVKQLASHFGATRNGMAISWPGHIATPGGIRSQYHHVIDVMPTILEAAKVSLPGAVDGVTQQPFDGVSMSYSFNAPKAPPQRTTQYYNIWDNMAVYHDGWVAASVPAMVPWEMMKANNSPAQVEGRQWQLFNITRDFSESKDVAAQNPAKLEELKQLFFAEAKRNHALPIHRTEGREGFPDYNAGRTSFRYNGPVARIPGDVAPAVSGNSFDVKAAVSVDTGNSDGTLMAIGGKFGGMALYIKDGKPSFQYNTANLERTTIVAQAPLAPGKHDIALRFDRQKGWIAPATATLVVDGKEQGSVTVPRSIAFRFTLDESFDIGSDTGTPASDAYQTPNTFAGTIETVEVNIRK